MKARIMDWLMWDGMLAQIVAIANEPTVVIEFEHEEKCPHCSKEIGCKQISVIPTSPQFKEKAKPLQTLEL